MERTLRNKSSYLNGQAAEHQVARHYAEQGYHLTAQRWRGAGGEIDLIFMNKSDMVFVEVKKSVSFARACRHFSSAQAARIREAALSYLASQDMSQDTNTRFDLVLLDQNADMQIIANAF